MITLIGKRKDGKILKMENQTQDQAFKAVRRYILDTDSVEETSADLMAMQIVSKAMGGNPQLMQNIKLGSSVLVQPA